MAGHRLPRTLFGGRMRTSTALLAVAFVGVLLLWLAVRPEPEYVTEEVVRVRTKTTVKQADEQEKARPPEAVRPTLSPSPTPTRTPSPKPDRKPTSTATPGVTPGETPAATDLPLPGPGAEETPDTDAPPPPEEDTGPGGLFGLPDRSGRSPETRSPAVDPAWLRR
jgi:hypothetical protein